jgi:hypothetical protein
MKQPCPKCKSLNTYSDSPNMACLMCGKRWPMNGQQPTVISKKTTVEAEVNEMAIKKACRNCGRDKNIVGDGLCGGCYFSVKGMEKGTPEYDEELLSAKKRFTDPNYRKKTAKQKPITKPAKTKSTLDMTVKEVAKTGIPGIIQRMRDEQAGYLLEAEKLGKAISILESIKP